MSVDLGIPIGCVVAITGAENIPDNFWLMDGTEVSTDGRSNLDGVTLPDWNSNKVTPIGTTDTSEATGEITSTGTYSEALTWDMIDEKEYSASTTVTISGVGDVDTADSEFNSDYSEYNNDEMTIDLPSSSMFDASYNYGSASTTFARVSVGNCSGSNWGLLYTDDSWARPSIVHSHTMTLYHPSSSHDAELVSSSYDYAYQLQFDNYTDEDLSSNITNSNQDDTEFPVDRSYIGVYWCMRVY
jgi:hypothetical protein